jgi:hypothetical protein
MARPQTPATAETVLRVSELLCEAAELEHSLVCQYLFAAFTLKCEDTDRLRPDQLLLTREWKRDLLLIARQEMEHLGLVTNILTAIGQAPYLARPNFPARAVTYPMDVDSELQPFGLLALARFCRFEAPEDPSTAQRQLLASLPGAGTWEPAMSLAGLYREIDAGLASVANQHPFIGPPGAQLVTADGVRGVHLSGAAYGVVLDSVTNYNDAHKVIERIVEEGEGRTNSDSYGHFERFCAMVIAYREHEQADSDFAPARRTRPVGPNDGTTPGTPGAIAALFDACYETLMVMLFRFFAHSDESAADRLALQNAAFFPMMTAVIRPLGDVLTTIPLGPGDPETLGPAFRFDRPISLLPHRDAAWSVIQGRLAVLAARARASADAARSTWCDRPQARLELVAENLARMTGDFEAAMRSER